MIISQFQLLQRAAKGFVVQPFCLLQLISAIFGKFGHGRMGEGLIVAACVGLPTPLGSFTPGATVSGYCHQ